MMQEEPTLQESGSWNQLVGELKKAWGDLTDDDLKQAEGDMQKLVGVIQQKTGETSEAVQKKIDELKASL